MNVPKESFLRELCFKFLAYRGLNVEGAKDTENVEEGGP